MIKPEELKRLYRQGRLVPFVGAGISMAVTWKQNGKSRRGPSWAELVDEAASRLGFKYPVLPRVRGTDLQILEYFRIRHSNLAPLNVWLARTMEPPEEALRSSPVHRELAAMINCGLFYTTNFDNFLERAFRLFDREFKTVVIEEHMGERSSACEIVKFHGDLEFPDNMVLSESDYERRLRLDTPIDLRFQADMLGRAILFLGYSFRDPNVAYIFHVVNDRLKGLPNSPSGRRAFIVVADPSDFEIRLFGARNIEVVPVRGEYLSEDIAALLAEIRS